MNGGKSYRIRCTVWFVVCVVLVTLLYISNLINLQNPALAVCSVFTSEKHKSKWIQTQDGHLPCEDSTTDYLVSSQLLQWSRECHVSDSLVFDDRGHRSILLGNRETSDDNVCPRKPVKATFELPVTGLVSWPGSGNTWSRHLIQQLTGLLTGSVDNDTVLLSDGFPGEMQREGMVVVKSHFTASSATRIVHFHKQILVIRNPYYTLVADYKRWNLDMGHTGKTDIDPSSKEWLSYVTSRTVRWSYFVRGVLAFGGPQLIVMYEDLKTCLTRELVHLANFLRTPDLKKFSLCCALSNHVGRYYRNQGRVPIYSLYNVTARAQMNSMLTVLAEDFADDLPIFSRRLLEYRIL